MDSSFTWQRFSDVRWTSCLETAFGGNCESEFSGRRSLQTREWKLYIEDILEAAERIQGYIHGMNFEAFCADRRTVDAVTHNVEIVGEATRSVPVEVRGRYAQVPWDQMYSMRNVLVHHYYKVNLAILWTTATKDIPPVVPLLEELLTREA
ncbi:MAG: HepT-like ribonuclease domain-containing protein [Dehalococcoidia bacterium]